MNNEKIEKYARVIADDFNGIIPYHKEFYLQSMLYSARVSNNAFTNYFDLLEDEGTYDDPDMLICVLQEAIGHAAALSRYFWPSTSGSKKVRPNQLEHRKKRGEKLCKLFNLDKTSVLHKRNIRDSWEHFDERIDTYLLNNHSGVFLPQGQIGNYKQIDEALEHIFMLLDIENECLILMGEKYFFSDIHIEVSKIYKVLRSLT